MKKIILTIFFLLLLIPNVYASESTASEYILMDMKTSRILKGKDYNKPRLIASITKIMTALIAIESGKLDNEVIVSDIVNKSYGSGIYIKAGEKLTLRDLLYGLMLRSGNDASLMISEYISGDVDKFVSLMNKKATKIGMKNTTFVNPSGLDNTDTGNYSTAYDMALLTKYAMKYKEYRNIVKTKTYTLKTNMNTYVWKNKNKLLKYDYITGGKTGYTEKAKRTLVSTSKYQNMEFIVVTIRDSDDWNTHKTLHEYAIKEYKPYTLMTKNKFKIEKNKLKGKLYIKNDIIIPLLEQELDKTHAKVKLYDNKYKNKSKVGEYIIYLDNKIIYKEKIYIKKNKKKNQREIL